MTEMAFAYVCIVLAYSGIVMVLSVFIINSAPFRLAEDVCLLGLAVFACYAIYLDNSFYKEGQFLLVDSALKSSCKSRFLSYFPLDELCRDVVTACSEHAPDVFQYGEEPASKLGRLLTSAVIIVFKVAAVWFEHRMALT